MSATTVANARPDDSPGQSPCPVMWMRMGVKAKLVDGVLTVTVPKAEKAKPRQISVQ